MRGWSDISDAISLRFDGDSRWVCCVLVVAILFIGEIVSKIARRLNLSILLWLISKGQVDRGVAPAFEGIVGLIISYLLAEFEFHPLYELQVILIPSLD